MTFFKESQLENPLITLLADDFFNKSSRYTPKREGNTNHPVDISLNEDSLLFEIECAGLSKEDIEVETEGVHLRVTYKKEDATKEDKKYLFKSIKNKEFDMSFKINTDFDLKSAKATFANGLLIIEVPKNEKIKKDKLKIKIK